MLREHETFISDEKEKNVMEVDGILGDNSSPFMVRDINWWTSKNPESFTTEVLFENLNGEPTDPYGTLATEKTEGTSESFIDSANIALKDAACKVSPVTDRVKTLVSIDDIKIQEDGQPLFEITAKFDLGGRQLISRDIHESLTHAVISALVRGYTAICALNA